MVQHTFGLLEHDRIALRSRVKFMLDQINEQAAILWDAWDSENFTPKEKSDGTLTTKEEQQVELTLRQSYLEQFPNDYFIGEEFGRLGSDSKLGMYLDPNDATRAAIGGEETVAMTGYWIVDSVPTFGFVHHYPRGELYTAEVGEGAYLGSSRLPKSSNPNLISNAVINAHADRDLGERLQGLHEYDASGKIGKLVSNRGSPALALSQVALGRHAGFVGISSYPWRPLDVTGGILLVQEAGGVAQAHDKVLVAGATLDLYNQLTVLLEDTGILK